MEKFLKKKDLRWGTDMGEIYVVGIGPGEESLMSGQAIKALEASDVIVGYTVYIDLIKDKFTDKELISTPMKSEVERCKLAFDKAKEGKAVSMVCSGDAGIYGMAALMYEIGEDYDNPDIVVIPGITAASAGGAVLGAPINHDFCVISLSDLLTPWEMIERRLRCAAMGDFAIVLYNPSSHKRADYLAKACDILLETISDKTVCGYVENIGRDDTKYEICSLGELKGKNVNMFTTVFVGNSKTKQILNKMVTPRGYSLM